jgi:UDP-N-acetylglucosamine 2-epimerase (non-hydrolysing)
MKTKVLLVAGARPNYMKIAPIHWAFTRAAESALDMEIVHTGQHYDTRLSDDFFRDLELPEPSVNLGVGSGSHAEQTAKVMVRFERVLAEKRPGMVVVVGDVNSTAACALVTAKTQYEGGARPLLVHVEAGLRSGDRSMPEEINRIVTDALSDVCFTTCRDADANLLAEGVSAARIRFVGNPMIDSLLRCLTRAERSTLLPDLGLTARGFGLCTLHRPVNVDRRETLGEILDALGAIAADTPILFPLHPRTRSRIDAFGLGDRLTEPSRAGRNGPLRGLLAIEPLSYFEMLQAMRHAGFVLTDSGGIQEETTALGVPCVTLRENTERPVTIAEGTNVLAGTSRHRIVDGLAEAQRKTARAARAPELWDGHAGERIVAELRVLASGSGRTRPSGGAVAEGARAAAAWSAR